MRTRFEPASGNDLEGLCEPASHNRIAYGQGTDGIERIEAHLTGKAFSPHRHDTYAIGVTLSGVQTFRYRGARHHCLPSQYHVLHPDETHDGASGTDAGFSYRIIYIDPSLIQSALQGRSLPFVADPVVASTTVPQDLRSHISQIHRRIDDMARIDLAVAAADMLVGVSVGSSQNRSLPLSALQRVRHLIGESPATQHSVQEFEAVSGLDRWTIARQFRAAFGTSPRRFRTMRQLDIVRDKMQRGMPLAETALEAGFADQSHMSRMFKQAYGLTPARWLAASRPRVGTL